MAIEDDIRIVDDSVDDTVKDLTLHQILKKIEDCCCTQFRNHVFELLFYSLDELSKQEMSLCLAHEVFLNVADRRLSPNVFINTL